jgi:hypothetical protein
VIRATLFVIISSVSSSPAWAHGRGNPSWSRVTTGPRRFARGLTWFLFSRVRFRTAILLCSIFVGRLFLTPAGTDDPLRRWFLIHDVNSFL